jgi:hypothetical protein
VIGVAGASIDQRVVLSCGPRCWSRIAVHGDHASPDLSAEDVDDSDEIFGANATAKQKSEFLKCLAAAGF